MTKTQLKKDPIPGDVSREELAKFWDTHSLADYLDELKPVKVRFAKNLSQGITVRFEPRTLEEIKRKANEKGVGITTLVRMWVLERLNTRHSATMS